MLYKFKNGHLVFKHIDNSEMHSYLLPNISTINFMTIDDSGWLIAFSANDSQGNEVGIFLCNLKDDSIKHIYQKACFEVKFYALDRLVFNSGNRLNILDLKTGKISLLHKFSRVQYAPISLSFNTNSNCLSFHKWKSDNQRLFIYDLKANTESDMGMSFFHYCWYDNQHIIYSLGDGLKFFNIYTKNKERIIRNAKTLIQNYCENIGQEQDISIIKGRSLDTGEVKNPVYRNQRIYFEVFLYFNNTKHIGIYSIADNRTDLKCHYTSHQGLIRDYGILSDGETVYVYVEPNQLRHETIQAQMIYIKGNQKVDCADWLPVQVNSAPSRFELR